MHTDIWRAVENTLDIATSWQRMREASTWQLVWQTECISHLRQQRVFERPNRGARPPMAPNTKIHVRRLHQRTCSAHLPGTAATLPPCDYCLGVPTSARPKSEPHSSPGDQPCRMSRTLKVVMAPGVLRVSSAEVLLSLPWQRDLVSCPLQPQRAASRSLNSNCPAVRCVHLELQVIAMKLLTTRSAPVW